MNAGKQLGADRPIDDPGSDLFGHARFAQMLAKSVLRASPSHGMVVGIYGPWGSGKSTVLNFIEKLVEQDSHSRPDAEGIADVIVLRFNPWWFSGREDLLRRFFVELSRAINKKAPKLVSVSRAARNLAAAVSKIQGFATDPLAKVAVEGALVAIQAAEQLLEPSTDVCSLKRDLDAALAAEVRRVLVLVDDVDRLPPQEMLDVFQLLKSVGDLTGVTYVLALDRAVVANALSKTFGGFGEGYLDKIVQVPFELPPPTDDALRAQLFASLDDDLVNQLLPFVELEHFNRVFTYGVGALLSTPRHVVRLANALAVTFPSVSGDVNPTDFLALEALRLNVPTAYQAIRDNPDAFVGARPLVASRDSELQDALVREHDTWLAKTGDARATVEHIVARLFPGLLKGGGPSNSERSLLRRRICHEECFAAYFRYSLSPDEATGAELTRLLGACDVEAAEAVFGACLGTDPRAYPSKYLSLLERLSTHLRARQPVVNAETLLAAVLATSDAATRRGNRLFVNRSLPSSEIAKVALKLIVLIPATSRCAIVAQHAAKCSPLIRWRLFRALAQEHGRFSDVPTVLEDDRLLTTQELGTIEELVVADLKFVGQTEAFLDQAELPWLLLGWAAVDPVVFERLCSFCKQDENLMRLVRATVLVRESLGGSRWAYLRELLRALDGEAELPVRLETMISSSVSVEDKDQLRAVLVAATGKDKGSAA